VPVAADDEHIQTVREAYDACPTQAILLDE
jgi:ferredoxin